MQKTSSVFIVYIHLFLHLKPNFKYLSLNFVRLSWGRTTNELAINWQNFIRVSENLHLAKIQ